MHEKGAIPDSFAAISHFANIVLAKRYGVSTMTITRWRKRLGTKPRLPVPHDFAQWAPGKTIGQIAERYVVGECVIRRWRRESGVRGYDMTIDPVVTRHLAPVPDDFAERVHLYSDRELGRHYGRNYKTVRRWREEAGIEREKRVRKAEPRRERTPAEPAEPAEPRAFVRPVAGRMVLVGASVARVAPLAGREQEAAQFLRREAAVYRCTERGGADQKGSHWRVGNAVLTAAELIERAERKGWDADAWRRVA